MMNSRLACGRRRLLAALICAPLAARIWAEAANADESAATGVFHGVGIVTEVIAQSGAITLDHEAIPGFMDAMIMTYKVDPPALSAGLHVGDKIDFDIDAGRYAIIAIKAVSAAK
jgi:Cu/Ag efflux protein CusF